jgi:hypothetical protein
MHNWTKQKCSKNAHHISQKRGLSTSCSHCASNDSPVFSDSKHLLGAVLPSCFRALGLIRENACALLTWDLSTPRMLVGEISLGYFLAPDA